MIDENRIQLIKIEDIIPNRFQPRERFDEESLEDLAKSIKEHGVIQPILVRKLGDKYELIAGERRTKASSLAGLTTIPAIIRDMDDKESAKLSLLENLQRKNLTAIEEAKTYKRILQLDNITQDELAKTMGRSQPMVANKLRLLSLPEEVQDSLVKNQISERHARSLLTIKDKKDQLMFLDRIKKERLTVRELDKEIRKYKEKQENNNEEEKEEKDMNNNRSNFGGMGLNDYQSGVGNNMFNNIPNNFNNMALPVGVNETSNNYNYGEFSDNNTFDNQSIPVTSNNGMNIGNNGSLGSLFDGEKQQSNIDNNIGNNNGDNNLFISQIREDNLPKKENQFLPNFDDNNDTYSQNDFSLNNSFVNSDTNNSTNFNSPLVSNPETMNYETSSNNYSINNNQFVGQPMDIDYQTPTNSFNEVNNISQNNMNTFYPNPNYQQNMNQTMQPENTAMYNNQPYYGHEMPVQQPQAYNPQVNNDYAMNSFENYNSYNKQNYNRIPEFENVENNYSNPIGGNLFNQPLNIVGPYGTPQMSDGNINSPSPVSPTVEERQISKKDIMSPISPEEIPVEKSLLEQSVDTYTPNEEKKEEVTSSEMETPAEETNTISDIEVIDDVDIPVPTNESEESKQDYISLDEKVTIHNVHDAVLELKKVTDKIKQNHIDIDTEEVEFDDVYQITIKIKKEEN